MRSELKPDEDIEVLWREYKGKEQNPLYETAMDLILRANWETCQEVEKMCDALRELFADELEERETIGLEKGLEQGKMAKLITQVMRKREKGQSASRIAEDLMEPADVVQRLYDLIGLHPDSDAEHILAYMESWIRCKSADKNTKTFGVPLNNGIPNVLILQVFHLVQNTSCHAYAIWQRPAADLW